MDRRTFLKKTLVNLLYGLSAIFVAYPTVSFIIFRRPREKTIVFSPDEQRPGVHFKEGVFLIKDEEGLFVLSARCTHLGCALNYDPFSRRFRCPCHGSVFDHKGKRLEGPAKRDLIQIPIHRKETGEVSVTVGL